MNDAGDRRVTRVTVLDEPFAIQSDAAPEYTERVASHVDRALRELRGAAPTLDPFPIAVLGAMEITDHLFQATDGVDSTVADAVTRIDGIAAKIDAALERKAEEVDGDTT